MKAFIVQFPFGFIALNEENAIVANALFPKKPQAAAKALLRIESGKTPEAFTTMITQLKDAGYDYFVFDNAVLANEAQKKLNVKTELLSQPSEASQLMEKFAVETGFVKDAAELNIWNRNITMEIAKLRVKGAVEKRDLVVAQEIQTLDDLDRTVNLFMGRLREWYGVHFPELDRLIEKHETYARLVVNLGDKSNFALEALEKEEVPKAKAEAIANVTATSMGADIAKADLATF